MEKTRNAKTGIQKRPVSARADTSPCRATLRTVKVRGREALGGRVAEKYGFSYTENMESAMPGLLFPCLLQADPHEKLRGM